VTLYLQLALVVAVEEEQLQAVTSESLMKARGKGTDSQLRQEDSGRESPLEWRFLPRETVTYVQGKRRNRTPRGMNSSL